MLIGKIDTKNNFGKVSMNLDAYECMRDNGATKSDIRRLSQMKVRGGDARIYYEDGEGYFLRSQRAGDVFIGNNPTYEKVINIIDAYNSHQR